MQGWIFMPALPALVAALGLALVGRLLRQPWLAGLAAGAGLLLGWWWTFGMFTASPRQLPERLPLLALALLGFAALGCITSRWTAGGVIAATGGVLATGWWMAGAPLTEADLLAALPVLGGVAAGAALALRQPGRWSAPLAAAALLAGLALAGLPGPGLVLGAALLAAPLGAAVPAGRKARAPGRGGSAAWGVPAGLASALPVAGGMAGLAALPLLARGAPSDWAAAAAPLAVLWLAPPIAAWLPRRAGVLPAALVAALPFLALAWLLR